MDERQIGQTIRSLRLGQGLTLTELAAKSDLTKSTLSKIETGQISSPIATLMRLAAAMHVPLADFFTQAPTTPSYVLTRKNQGRIITKDGTRFGYAYEALALDMPRKSAEPFVLTVCPGDGVGKFKHGGEEFIYMLSGKLRFTVGSETMLLAAGDSLYFDPQQVHSTEVVGKTPARFLCVFIQSAGVATSRGER